MEDRRGRRLARESSDIEGLLERYNARSWEVFNASENRRAVSGSNENEFYRRTPVSLNTAQR